MTLQVRRISTDDAFAALAPTWSHLRERRDWDVARLRKLPADSRTVTALETALPAWFRWREAGRLLSPYVAIDRSWTEFWNGTSARFKKTVRNVQNRLSRAGKVTIDEHRVLDSSGHLLDEAIDVSRRSWKAERGLAIATMRHMPEFFSELSRRAGARGWLSLWFVRLDGRAIATEYQLRVGGIVHALRADYDLEYGALSPGS